MVDRMRKVIRTVKVKNALGLHARPATAIVKLLQDFKSEVLISYRKETINARSIMSILMLAIKKNSQIILTVNGDDAFEAMEKLLRGFETSFGEAAH
jgi:phosphocarrier protein